MSFAIETDLGRFEAETEREAKKLLRAAQKKQAEKDARANELYQIARGRACQEAYKIYSNKLSGKSFPQGWRIKPVTESSYTCTQVWDNERLQRGFRIETNNGCVTVFPYDPITHCVENGAGFCMAILIANQDSKLFAVGVAEDHAVWVALEGIEPEDFRADV